MPLVPRRSPCDGVGINQTPVGSPLSCFPQLFSSVVFLNMPGSSSHAGDLVLDSEIKYWVLLPLTVSVLLLMLLRQFASVVRP